MIYKLFLLTILSLSISAKSPELIARADSNESFRLPLISYISNSTIDLNSKGEVVFSFIAIIDQEVRQCIWYSPKDSSKGRIIHTAGTGNALSDPDINDSGEITFIEHNEFEVENIYVYSAPFDRKERLPVDKSKYRQARDSKINEAGDIIFRATDHSGYKEVLLYKSHTFKSLIGTYKSNFSYIFSANFSGPESIILKARLGSRGQLSERRPDQILKVNFRNEIDVLVEDSDSNNVSTILAFNNSIGSSPIHNNVTFIAKPNKGTNSLYRIVNNKLEKILSEGEHGIKSLEYFTPSINSKGHIAFRAISNDSKRSIFLYDGNHLRKYISGGDLISTDVMTAQIHSSNGPEFGGGININELDEVVYQAKIFSKYLEKDLGTVVLKSSF